MHFAKNKISFFLATFFVIVNTTCGNNEKPIKIKNTDTLNYTPNKIDHDILKDSSKINIMKFIINYNPKGIELCDGVKDTLRHYDLKYIFSVSSDTIKRKIIYSILLKQYKYQLVNSHQGYDLLAMRDEPCSIFIDEFIKLDSLQFEHEFLNSGYVYYNLLKQKKMKYILQDTLITRLVKDLDIVTNKLDNKK